MFGMEQRFKLDCYCSLDKLDDSPIMIIIVRIHKTIGVVVKVATIRYLFETEGALMAWMVSTTQFINHQYTLNRLCL